jgi:spore coat polysaccharide biosynthesis protein SpsF (cytidylyltransferase family)
MKKFKKEMLRMTVEEQSDIKEIDRLLDMLDQRLTEMDNGIKEIFKSLEEASKALKNAERFAESLYET